MHVKTLRLVTLLLWSLSNPAIAQAPPLSLPMAEPGTPDSIASFPIPPILSGTDAAPLPPATPAIPEDAYAEPAAASAPQPLPLTLAEEAGPLPEIRVPEAEPRPEAASNAPTSPPANVIAKRPARALTADTNLAPAQALPSMPALPSPIQASRRSNAPPPLTLPTIAPPPLAATNPSVASPLSGGLLPNVRVSKSWEVALAPSIKPKTTKFDYRHAGNTLPYDMYRGPGNSHLPPRMNDTRVQAEYFYVIAQNNINATRAFIDAGQSIEAPNTQGDTPLIVALQFGALDVARLLVVHGANPHAIGAMGVSAMDYARALRADRMLQTLWEQRGA
jgi:hypothetical protein